MLRLVLFVVLTCFLSRPFNMFKCDLMWHYPLSMFIRIIFVIDFEYKLHIQELHCRTNEG